MDLTKEQQKQLEALAAEFGISLILAFGSKVKGTARPESDLDIAILLDNAENKTDTFLQLFPRLETVFPGERIDLAIINHADPLFLNQVMAQATRLFGSEEKFRSMKLLAFKQYQDHKPYLQMEQEYVRRVAAKARG